MHVAQKIVTKKTMLVKMSLFLGLKRGKMYYKYEKVK